MEIAVVGNPEFTLGFQLAGITHIHNPSDSEQTESVLRELLGSSEVGIVVTDSDDLTQLPERLRNSCQTALPPRSLVLAPLRIPPCGILSARRSEWISGNNAKMMRK